MPRRRTTRQTAGRARAAVLLAVPGVVILAGVSACASTSSPASAPTSASSPAAAASSKASSPTAAVSSPEAASSTAACTAADIEATLTEQPQRREGDSRMALLHLANTSSRTCTVAGWPVVTLVDAAGEAVTVPVEDVAEPGEAVPADLAPGGGAFAGIKWTICDKADAGCPTGNTVEVGLAKGGPLVAATLEGFPDPERSGITFGSLQVGTVQPSNQGVVAW